MIDPRNLDTLLHPQFDAAALKAATPVARALAASPGAACGKIVFYRRGCKGVGLQEVRRLFWFVWRPLRRISRV